MPTPTPQPRRPLRRLVDLRTLDAIRDNEQTRLMALGAGVGLLGGAAAAAFDQVMVWTGLLLLGTAEPAIEAPTLAAGLLAPLLGAVAVAGILALGGLPRGISHVVEAIGLHGGGVSLRNGVSSALSAAVALGTGHSGGREGPIVQLASALSSKACRYLGVPPARMRLLVAAGAAAGIAASFNTPIGASFFAMEILLGNFALEGFAPIVAATVTGTVTGQALMGERLALHLPAFEMGHPLELLLYPILGLCVGLIAVVFKEFMLRAAAWEPFGLPDFARPLLAGGGVAVLCTLGLPQVMGNGYAYIEAVIRGEGGPVPLLAAIVVAKLGVTALSVAGRNGVGMFAPALFVGALTGTAFGVAAGQLLPAIASPVGAYGMVGMGGMVAAITQAPITMTLMLFEMTGNYEIILPELLTLAVSGVVYRAVEGGSLFVQQAEARGVSLDRSREELVMYELHVADIMRKTFESVHVDTPIEELRDLFLNRRIDDVYVLDADERLHGIVDIQDIKHFLGAQSPQRGVLDLERRDVPHLAPSLPLADALPLFFRSELEELPVVDDEDRMLGVLTERDIVGAYNREVLRKEHLMARIESGPDQNRHVDFLELPEGQTMKATAVGERFAGKTLRELALPASCGVTVVAVDVWDAAAGKHQRVAADADIRLQSGDRLVVLGPSDHVEAMDTAVS